MVRVPLYKAAETEMLRRISEGEWTVGQRLPNEFGLADEFGVSQGTMRRALMSLESMGLLARKPGRGTIVAAVEATTPSSGGAVGAGFSRLFDSAGAPPDVTIFRAKASTRGADAAETALFDTGRLSILERTLKRDGDRFALEELIGPETRILSFDEAADVDFVTVLAEEGLSVASLDDSVTADVTTMSEAVALSVDRHTPLLVLTRVAKDSAGAPLARQVLKMVATDLGYQVGLTA